MHSAETKLDEDRVGRGYNGHQCVSSVRVISACHQCVSSGHKARTQTVRCHQCMLSVRVIKPVSKNSNSNLNGEGWRFIFEDGFP